MRHYEVTMILCEPCLWARDDIARDSHIRTLPRKEVVDQCTTHFCDLCGEKIAEIMLKRINPNACRSFSQKGGGDLNHPPRCYVCGYWEEEHEQ